MEELVVLSAAAIAFAFAVFLADLVGLALGLGWRHYSKKLAAKRLKDKQIPNG